MNDCDIAGTIEKYSNSYKEHGYSPKALGWDKGRQEIRFEALLSFFECQGKSILDIGCGFGDINRVLSRKVKSYDYTGIDLVKDLIAEGRLHYPQKNIRFINADFLEYPFTENFDIIVASGIFNHKFKSGENDIFVEKVLKKAWSLCTYGIAFDFLSDKVDYCYEHTHHNNPQYILGLGYTLSRNVALLNNYMPFEFCVYVGKDQSFNKTDAIFNAHKLKRGGL